MRCLTTSSPSLASSSWPSLLCMAWLERKILCSSVMCFCCRGVSSSTLSLWMGGAVLGSWLSTVAPWKFSRAEDSRWAALSSLAELRASAMADTASLREESSGSWSSWASSSESLSGGGKKIIKIKAIASSVRGNQIVVSRLQVTNKIQIEPNADFFINENNFLALDLIKLIISHTLQRISSLTKVQQKL